MDFSGVITPHKNWSGKNGIQFEHTFCNGMAGQKSKKHLNYNAVPSPYNWCIWATKKGPVGCLGYTLPETNIAHENHNFSW